MVVSQDWKLKLRRPLPREKTYHFIVGDVHGCSFELFALEEKARDYAKAAGARAFFVYVGDLIDRGPNSIEVVRHVMKGVGEGSHYCVAGNHEAIFLELIEFFGMGDFRNDLLRCRYIVPLYEQYAHSKQNKSIAVSDFAAWRLQNWLNQGGGATLESFGWSLDASKWDASIVLEELKFLSSLPLAYYSESVCVTHALASHTDFEWAVLRDSDPNFERTESFQFEFADSGMLAKTDTETMERLQSLLWNRDQLATWPADLPVHVSGHTPADEPLWYEKDRRLVIDTGCVYGRNLTAYCPETKECLEVTGYGLNF